MAEPVNYDTRSVWQNLFDPGAWANLGGSVGVAVKESKGVWDAIKGKSGDSAAQPVTVLPPTPSYQPNLQLSDFSFQPYMPLIIIGVVLLIVAMVIKRL